MPFQTPLYVKTGRIDFAPPGPAFKEKEDYSPPAANRLALESNYVFKEPGVIKKLIQGLAIGVAFPLPGLSIGTLILLLGFYREFVDDLARIRLKPYLPHLAGCAAGFAGGIYVIGYLLEHYLELLSAFLLGMLAASTYAVLSRQEKLRPAPLPLGLAILGFLFAWFFIGEPSAGMTLLPAGSYLHFFAGGAVASATMLLPGVSGSAALMIMNIYDDVVIAVNQWQWLNLAFFAAGGLAGLFILARLLSALFGRYSEAVSFLLAGLILGSTRVLLPAQLTPAGAALTLAGALLVVYLSLPRRQK